jgi:hypothetical protein
MTITTRAGKGSPLTNQELDANFTDLDARSADGVLRLTPTAYADLPSNPDASTNGMIAFLSTDGAGTPKYRLIFSDGGNWKYVSDNSLVASS